jgi:hypothetical protein
MNIDDLIPFVQDGTSEEHVRRHAAVLWWRFVANPPETLAAVGARFGVSGGSIRQEQERLIRRLWNRYSANQMDPQEQAALRQYPRLWTAITARRLWFGYDPTSTVSTEQWDTWL